MRKLSRRKFAPLVKFLTKTMETSQSEKVRMEASRTLTEILMSHDQLAMREQIQREKNVIRLSELAAGVKPTPEPVEPEPEPKVSMFDQVLNQEGGQYGE
jgi:hypothetical protein